MQVGVDHTTNSLFDIKNLADAGANTFEGNICRTAVNAPCPSVGPSLTASPNPIPVTGNAVFGSTTLSWNAPDAQTIEIHVGSPNGNLLTRMGNRASVQTGAWVADGTTFYLQDVTGGKPLTSDYTLATLVVQLQKSNAARFHFPAGPRFWAGGASAILLGLALGWVLLDRPGSRAKRLRFVLGGAVLPAAIVFLLPQTRALAQASPQASAQQRARLDQMTANGASPAELAQYVFDTHGCKNCHTVGRDGKLGFTAKGKERAQGFEGCINMLTAMTVIVQVHEDKRSPQQRQKAARFEEFGCTACHKLAPGKLGLTEVGTKLAHLHLGCVEVEKLVASRSGPRN